MSRGKDYFHSVKLRILKDILFLYTEINILRKH